MTADHINRAAEVIHSRIDPQGQITDGIGIRCLAAAEALADAGLLVSPERATAVAAKAWDEGFKQGGPMHDVNYDDPDAHTRNPYGRADRIEREAGESDGER